MKSWEKPGLTKINMQKATQGGMDMLPESSGGMLESELNSAEQKPGLLKTLINSIGALFR